MKNIYRLASALALAWLPFVVAEEVPEETKSLAKLAQELRQAESPAVAHELGAEITHRYLDLTYSLSATLRIADLSPQIKAETCYLLGIVRAERTVEILAKNIAFTALDPRSLDRLPKWSSRPCQEALVMIGKPAVPALIELIRTNVDRGLRNLATLTVFQIEGADLGAIVLQKAADDSTGEGGDRLKEAAAASNNELFEEAQETARKMLAPAIIRARDQGDRERR